MNDGCDGFSNNDAVKTAVTQLWEATVTLERTWKSFSPLPEINKSLFVVLMCLAHYPIVAGPPLSMRGDPVSIGVIAEQLQQSLPAISQKITALEELGYVERVQTKADRRVTGVCLTAHGKKQLEEGKRQMSHWMHSALSSMGDEKLTELVNLMTELNEALQATEKKTEN